MENPDIIYWNCGSGLQKKNLHQIKWYLENKQPEIFLVAEADLLRDKELSVFQCTGYIFHQSKTINSRGKCRLVAWVRPDYIREDGLEMDGNEIMIFSKNGLRIVGLYRHFKCYDGENMRTNFDRLMENLHLISTNELIIVGDFNVDPQRDFDSYFGRRLKEWKNECLLDQLTESETRTRLVAGVIQTSMIDLMFTNICGLKTESEFMSQSDHQMIYIKINCLWNKKSIVRKGISYLNWRKYSASKMSSLFEKYFCGMNIYNQDVDEINERITTAICQSLNELVPKRQANLTGNNPVINPSIRNLRNKKSRLLKKWKNTGNRF